jgi:hypothetical protein
MLYVRLKTKPLTRILRFVRILFLYTSGCNFKISAYVKNLDSVQFQGGTLRILVTYAFGSLYERINGKVGLIEPESEVKVDFKGSDVWGVLANGHALFWVNVYDNTNTAIVLCNKKAKPLQKQKAGYHLHAFHAMTFGELISLIALIVTSFAFITNIILMTFINRDKLSDVWNTLWYFREPLTVLVVIAGIVWLVLVYVVYDRLGL